MDEKTWNQELQNFILDVRRLMGLFGDATQGFYEILERAKSLQDYTIKMLQKSSPELATVAYTDTLTSTYGEETSPPTKVGNTTNHTITAVSTSTCAEIKERNSSQGSNHHLMSQLVIVMCYQLWETKYRKIFESILGRTIQLDIFGDLAQLRHSVLKNAGIVTTNAEKKCKKFLNIKAGDPIRFGVKELAYLVQEMEREIQLLKSIT